MPKYIIHIGPPKAGSKYLQTSLAGLRKRLGRQGISFPADLLTQGRVANHSVLDAPLRAGPSPALDRVFAGLNAGGHEVIVLSWEGAYSLQEPVLQYLRRLIGQGNAVEVVYYCRRFAERIPSLWRQDIKRGLVATLPETVARIMRQPMVVADHNPSLAWERWAQVFGRQSLRIVSLNNLREHKVDMFDHFAATFLKWKGTERSKRATVHEIPDTNDTEIGRALNALHIAKTGQSSGRVFHAYQARKPELDLGPIAEAMAGDTVAMKLDDRAGAFLPVYQAMMAFKDRLVSPEYGTELFTRAVSDVPYVRQNYLLQPGVVPALESLYRTLRPAITGPQPGAEAA